MAKDMPNIAEFLNKRTKKQDTVGIDKDDEESVHGSESRRNFKTNRKREENSVQNLELKIS